MDTEYSFIPVRKYQTPVEDVELESLPSPTSRQQPLFSAFERLPVELRQRVYSFLGYPVGGKVWMDVPGRNFSCDWLYTPARVKIAYFDLWRWDATLLSQGFPQGIRAYLDHPRLSDKIWNFEDAFYSYPIETALLLVNKNIRTELMRTTFQNTEMVFNFHLSDKALHYSRPESSWTFQNHRPEGRHRMYWLNEDFEYLTKITLGLFAGKTFSVNFPHSLSEISERKSLARQAMSIRYLADHCHSLQTFSIFTDLGRHGLGRSRRDRGLRTTAPQITQPIVLALATLAVKCETLEAIVISPPCDWNIVSDAYNIVRTFDEKPGTNQVVVLQDVPWYLREDKVLEEADVIFKMMTCTSKRKHVDE